IALRRAYQKANVGPETVALFEGHGTGTSVGDAVELRVLSQARRDAGGEASPAAIGSVKANIGHTKAAAGMAGLLKAALALHHQILPPTTGCERPHSELTGKAPALRIVPEGEPWPKDAPLRAGVSAMGFGGINTHVVLEGAAPHREADLSPYVHRLLTSPQDAELFLLGATDIQGLHQQIEHLLTLAPHLSLAELGDLAATLAARLTIRTVRAAVVAATASELTERLKTLAAWLEKEAATRFDVGVYLGVAPAAARIGFLFPGQGSPTASHGGALARRFAAARAVYAAADLPQTKEEVATDIAQPAIVAASVAALRVLLHCGVTASTAVGHSLGELTALHWGGVFDVQAVLRLATVRGRAMADLGTPTGAMAGLSADEETVRALIGETPVVIAGLNGPRQTVISGEEAAVDAVVVRARARQVEARMLRVSHAFHSDLVAAAAEPLAIYLADTALAPLQRKVVSTITGAPLGSDDDLKTLLVQQVTAPVRFTEAVTAAAPDVDLWIEVGSGRVLSSLANTFIEAPTVATAVGGPLLRGLLQAVGAAFAAGAAMDARALFEGRFTRPFSLDGQPQFLASPCEQAPASDPDLQIAKAAVSHKTTNGQEPDRPPLKAASTLDLVRQLVAARAELPLDAVREEDHLLSDLHLNSITVSELLVEATRHLKLAPSAAPTSYADATLADVAAVLDERVRLEERIPARLPAPPLTGIEAWIRPFTVVQVEQPRPPVQAHGQAGAWHVITPPDHPLREGLHKAFRADVAGRGVVVALPPGCTENHLSCLLEGARAVMDETEPCRFVLVQEGAGVAAFARTVHLELSQVTTCIVDVPLDHPGAVAWVVAEAQAATGFTEVGYDAEGIRRVPRLRLLPMSEEARDLPLGPEDVLLVTGGGKGITAACAFDLAQATGVRLVLVGRSQASEDDELAATLARMTDAGLDARYLALDITDAEAVRTALGEITDEIGTITAVIHGAARNVPQRLGTMDERALQETLAPKVDGLRHLLDVLDPQHLRLLVAFGSIIGRMGLPGEAHYALANEQLRQLVDGYQQAHPACRCLTIEWSIWSEVGMGARLGSIDALRQRGIIPIPPEQGLAILRQLLSQPLTETAVVVTGRFGEMPTLHFEEQPLPLWRFLEAPRRHVPGVELIVEARLSVDTDPYLNDHQVQGERLLPAVVGLEAMAQAAMALVDTTEGPVFESVAFNRPIVVPG
ncbi:MAG TPA: SDR family NAD(P)-dependent oxidoreductase, partial [Rhodothermales bacterium]|nr:SDR family NAD(P)-dependent oxidoreductase [Rhodothermales bacterium]